MNWRSNRREQEQIDRESVEKIVNFILNNKLEKLAEPHGTLETFAQKMSGKISSSKLRNIYDNVVSIYNEDDPETKVKRFLILYPKIKYQKKDRMPEEIILLFEKFIGEIKNKDTQEMAQYIDEFKSMLEMLVAFFKYYGSNKR